LFWLNSEKEITAEKIEKNLYAFINGTEKVTMEGLVSKCED